MLVPLAEPAGKDLVPEGGVNVRVILQRSLRGERLLAVGAAEHFASIAVASVACIA